MNVPASRVDTLVWTAIYGGLFGVGVGIALERNGQAFGWAMLACGAALAVAGTILIWVRSRMEASEDR
ncbi:MAG TPA: hypothetical protein VNS61_00740 [Caldimonas sp.]|nr:hypothetical protein [Caldimonas sp.]